MDDVARPQKQAAESGCGRDAASASAVVRCRLMIYGMVAGPVAVAPGYLAMRLGGSGIAAVAVSAVLVLVAGWYADPVLRRLRPPSRPR